MYYGNIPFLVNLERNRHCPLSNREVMYYLENANTIKSPCDVCQDDSLCNECCIPLNERRIK